MTGFMKTMSIISGKSPIMHFDFATPKGSLWVMQKKEKNERPESNKRKVNEWREKRLTFLSIFISSTLSMPGQDVTSLTLFS